MADDIVRVDSLSMPSISLINIFGNIKGVTIKSHHNCYLPEIAIDLITTEGANVPLIERVTSLPTSSIFLNTSNKLPAIVIKFFSSFKMLYYALLLYLFASSQKKFSAFKASCD